MTFSIRRPANFRTNHRIATQRPLQVERKSFPLPTFLQAALAASMAAATASSSSSSSSSPRSLGLTTPVSLLPAFLAFFAFEDGFGELLAEFGVSATFCCALSIRYLYYEHTWANSKAIAITHGNGKRGKSSLLRSCAGLALPTPPFS